jgi:hypothetical protein
MMLVNNGNYRRSLFVIRRFFDGEESFSGGFPVMENFLASFAGFPALSKQDFVRMPLPDYRLRLGAFYTFLSLKYPFFDPALHLPDPEDALLNAEGSDSAYCPVDFAPESGVFLSIETVLRASGSDRFATVVLRLRDGAGNLAVLQDGLTARVLVKEIAGVPEGSWDDAEGVVQNVSIAPGQSEATVVEEFRYRGAGELLSVEATLLAPQQEEVQLLAPYRVAVSSAEPAFLFNHISGLQKAYQEMIDRITVQEKIHAGEGIRVMGKRSYTFSFEPDRLRRPVFVYPAAWGKLSGILLVQAQNMNIIHDGAFLLDQNGNPAEYSVEIAEETVSFYVYASKAMVSYPYRADYVFEF